MVGATAKDGGCNCKRWWVQNHHLKRWWVQCTRCTHPSYTPANYHMKYRRGNSINYAMKYRRGNGSNYAMRYRRGNGNNNHLFYKLYLHHFSLISSITVHSFLPSTAVPSLKMVNTKVILSCLSFSLIW